MRALHSLLLSIAALRPLCLDVVASLIPGSPPITRNDLDSTTVQRELGGQLSNTTSIFGPGDPRFGESTARWSLFARPTIQVVIEPGRESDVPIIIRYCDQNSIDFLTYNRGHGWSRTLGSFNGIQIGVGSLDTITISPDRKSAWFQGGVYGGPAKRYLWSRGYTVATGSCDCVGLLGAGLGGGHGRLEGRHGMVSDNIRQLNVVLANGSSIVVNGTSHADLLWGMRGAGHNFGVVTSFEMDIWPRGPDTWFYKNYIWRGPHLDAVFTALNQLHGNGTTPVDMAVNFGNFFFNASVSREPLIHWSFAYRGSQAAAAPYFARFDAIDAVSVESGNVPYPDVAHAMQTGEQDPICGEDVYGRITTTAGVQVYNLTAERRIWDGFARRVAENPELAASGVILHEGYSTAGVAAVSSDGSAYPFRSDHHLLLFSSLLPPGSGLEGDAWEWAREVRDHWNDGQPGRLPDAYVNYANGLEPVEQIYGHETWRIQRLQRLKAAYDPQNRFRFFNPIIPSH